MARQRADRGVIPRRFSTVQNERLSFRLKAVRRVAGRVAQVSSGARLASASGMRSSDSKAWISGSATPKGRPAPKAGDVLVSERTARADVYDISVVPAQAHMMVQRYDEAIETVRQLARQRNVDGWCTVDQTHYAQIARYRTSSGG